MIRINRDEVAAILQEADSYESGGVVMEHAAYLRAAEKIVLLVREREIEALEHASDKGTKP